MEPDLAHSQVLTSEQFLVKLVFSLTGHMTCHGTFSGKQPLFGELVAVFSIISHRENAFQMHFPLTFGLTVSLFTEKIYRVKGRLFQQNLALNHLYLLKTKSRKTIPNVARQEISIFVENTHLLINRPNICHQFADLPKFNRTITRHVTWSR